MFCFTNKIYFLITYPKNIESNLGPKTKTKKLNFFYAAIGMSIVMNELS